MNTNIARPMPHSVLASAIRAEGDPARILAEMNAAVLDFKSRYGDRLAAVESDIDRLSNKWAGSVAAFGNGRPHGRGRSDEAMKALAGFARHKSASPIELRDYLATADIRASMEVGSQPDGGYLIIPQIEKSVLALSADVSPMRSLATVVTVGTDAYEFLADPSMAEVTWLGETDSRPQTAGSKFFKGRIPVMEMAAQPPVTQSLLDDSFVDIGAYLTNRIGQAFALKEAAAFSAGTGVMQPRGFLSYPMTTDDDFNSDGSRNRAWGTLQYYAVGASDPSDAQLADGIVNLAAQLRSPYRGNARWLLSRQMYARLRTTKDSTGKYLLSTDGRIADGQPELLVGFPIGGGTVGTMFDEGMPSTTGANALIAALGDWKQGYCIVDRVGIRILRDPFTAKPFVLFYTTKRVGGGVQNFDAIKLLKCSAS
ncbi:MAG TPA: phage major capsid protein [Xanthobacteraceae bacterium]|nr:phage major capsid protein [Xanthobacteraceae bacterium]